MWMWLFNSNITRHINKQYAHEESAHFLCELLENCVEWILIWNMENVVNEVESMRWWWRTLFHRLIIK